MPDMGRRIICSNRPVTGRQGGRAVIDGMRLTLNGWNLGSDTGNPIRSRVSTARIPAELEASHMRSAGKIGSNTKLPQLRVERPIAAAAPHRRAG